MEHHNYNNSHNHDHSHHHHDVSAVNRGKLFFVIVFNLVISAAEIIGGVISGSLSLVSDSVHNMSDTASLILSYVSIKISEKPKSSTKTYGYKRVNILSAFINSAALTGISIFLIVGAVKKFANPQNINGNTVIAVATVGLLGNLLSVIFLRNGAKDSMNLKSSYLHMLSDTLSSVAVIAAGFAIKYFSVYWIDPVLTIIINMAILRACYDILKETIDILMQGTPLNINIEEIKKELLSVKGIEDIHHIHIWRLDEKNTMLEAHVLVNDMLVSETREIGHEAGHILMEHFNITHTVIQFENMNCSDKLCSI